MLIVHITNFTIYHFSPLPLPSLWWMISHLFLVMIYHFVTYKKTCKLIFVSNEHVLQQKYKSLCHGFMVLNTKYYLPTLQVIYKKKSFSRGCAIIHYMAWVGGNIVWLVSKTLKYITIYQFYQYTWQWQYTRTYNCVVIHGVSFIFIFSCPKLAHYTKP